MNPFRLSTRRTRSQPPTRVPSFSVSPWQRVDDVPAPVACVVPWRLARNDASGVIELENVGEEPLLSVRFALAGAGLLGLSLPSSVAPGERLRVVLRGTLAESATAGADAMLVLRWFRVDGVELLWPISL